MKKVLVVAGLLVAIGLVCCVGSSLVNSNNSTSSSSSRPVSAPATESRAWIPSGFTRYDDSVAYRWMDSPELKCTYSGVGSSCFGMEVVAHYGCDNLYVELSELDASGASVGFTNDVAVGIPSGGRAKLVFDTFDSGVSKARISKVQCY